MYSVFTSPIFQIVLSAIIILAILFQSSEKGMDGAFGGGSSESGSGSSTKRGLELRLYHITIFVSILLAGSALVKIFFS
jgi:protein translocase SecG subunit